MQSAIHRHQQKACKHDLASGGQAWHAGDYLTRLQVHGSG
jgi:hypothetical protein